MRRTRFLIGLSFVLLIVACGGDRYAIVSGEGGTYRLDKRTGEVLLIRQKRSYRVLSPEETERAEGKGRFTVQP